MTDIDPLTELAIKHGTDKWGEHFYTPVYHGLFQAMRLEKLLVLEIGIGGFGMREFGGESLRMWAEYFPNGRIVGIDIQPKKLALPANVHCEQGSQADPQFLERLAAKYGAFDIVVDDGSHRPDDMIASFVHLFPRMSARGIYVIEDTQTAFWPRWGGSPDGAKLLRFMAALVQGLHRNEIAVEKPDYAAPAFASGVKSVKAVHNLLIVERGDSSEPSNYKLDLDHPTAKFALGTIERRVRTDPTPGCYARYAVMLHLGGRADQALGAVEGGLGLWPDHPDLLKTGYDIAKARGDAARALGYATRLKAKSADPMVNGMLAAVKPGG